jgi:hypothetical protein
MTSGYLMCDRARRGSSGKPNLPSTFGERSLWKRDQRASTLANQRRKGQRVGPGDVEDPSSAGIDHREQRASGILFVHELKQRVEAQHARHSLAPEEVGHGARLEGPRV